MTTELEMITRAGLFTYARVLRHSRCLTAACIAPRTAALILATAAVAACGELPAEPSAPPAESADVAMAGGGAQRLVLEDSWDLTGHLLHFSCDADGNYDEDDGEQVRLHGGIFSRYTATLTPSLNMLVNYGIMAVRLGGVGVDSGEEFSVRLHEHANATITHVGSTEPYRYSLTLTGRTTGRRFGITYNGTFVVRDGRIIVDRSPETVSCRAPVRG
jgi:hypothetical protein